MVGKDVVLQDTISINAWADVDYAEPGFIGRVEAVNWKKDGSGPDDDVFEVVVDFNPYKDTLLNKKFDSIKQWTWGANELLDYPTYIEKCQEFARHRGNPVPSQESFYKGSGFLSVSDALISFKLYEPEPTNTPKM